MKATWADHLVHMQKRLDKNLKGKDRTKLEEIQCSRCGEMNRADFTLAAFIYGDNVKVDLCYRCGEVIYNRCPTWDKIQFEVAIRLDDELRPWAHFPRPDEYEEEARPA